MTGVWNLSKKKNFPVIFSDSFLRKETTRPSFLRSCFFLVWCRSKIAIFFLKGLSSSLLLAVSYLSSSFLVLLCLSEKVNQTAQSPQFRTESKNHGLIIGVVAGLVLLLTLVGGALFVRYRRGVSKLGSLAEMIASIAKEAPPPPHTHTHTQTLILLLFFFSPSSCYRPAIGR